MEDSRKNLFEVYLCLTKSFYNFESRKKWIKITKGQCFNKHFYSDPIYLADRFFCASKKDVKCRTKLLRYFSILWFQLTSIFIKCCLKFIFCYWIFNLVEHSWRFPLLQVFWGTHNVSTGISTQAVFRC